MAHHKSAIKRIRTNKKENLRNRAYRTQMRNALRKVRETTDPAARQASLREAVSVLDRLVSKGVVRKGFASRRKSRLAHFVARMETPAAN